MPADTGREDEDVDVEGREGRCRVLRPRCGRSGTTVSIHALSGARREGDGSVSRETDDVVIRLSTWTGLWFMVIM